MNYKNKRRLVVGFEIVDGNYQRSHILEIKESDLGKSWDQWDKVDPEEQENIIDEIVKEDFFSRISYEIISISDEDPDYNQKFLTASQIKEKYKPVPELDKILDMEFESAIKKRKIKVNFK